MNKSIILDTNLTVLLVVGLVELSQVGAHKRTKSYDQTDFKILEEIISNAKNLIFTPNVLTEASNLLRQTHDSLARKLSNFLAKVLAAQSVEISIASEMGFARKEYERLGLTDSVLLHLSNTNGGAVVVTADLDLYLACCSDGLEVINFTHIRASRTDFVS